MVEKTKIPKKISFRNKKTIYITSNEASKLKFFINNTGLKKNKLNKIFLDNPLKIHDIINRSTYV